MSLSSIGALFSPLLSCAVVVGVVAGAQEEEWLAA